MTFLSPSLEEMERRTKRELVSIRHRKRSHPSVPQTRTQLLALRMAKGRNIDTYYRWDEVEERWLSPNEDGDWA